MIFIPEMSRGVSVSVLKQEFGNVEGVAVDLYTLTNDHGCSLSVTNYGAIIQSLKVPNKSGNLHDVVLGFDTLDGYVENNPYFGCVVGRCGNRIEKGQFSIDDVTYSLAVNNGENHLHGGLKGFDKVVWNAKPLKTKNGPGVVLSYVSPDGEEGYPGTVEIRVVYILTHSNELLIDYFAESDAKTILNCTNHSYFNLGSHETIFGHDIRIESDYYTPVNTHMIPTGAIAPVEGTALDFSTTPNIGDLIQAEGPELLDGGFDHNMIIKCHDGELRFAAQIRDRDSGIKMDCFTTEPGLQFYTGNFLTGEHVGKENKVYSKYAGLCLEAQHFPNSPNRPEFPSVLLSPGEEYAQTTIYSFSIL